MVTTSMLRNAFLSMSGFNMERPVSSVNESFKS